MAIKGTKSTENGYDVYTMGGGSSPSYGGSSSGSGGSSSAGKGQGGNGPNGGFVKKSGSGGGSAAKAYEKALAAQNAQRKSMYDSSLGQINQSADEALRQAYLQKTKAEYAAPQQALAMGATGGMSESTLAAMNAAYGNNRNNIDTARMGGIEQATGAYNEGQAADLAGYNQQLAALALREEDRKYQQAQYERELANQQSQYNRELTDKKAMMEYQKQLDAKYRVATGGGSGGSSTKAWKPPISPSELMKMIDAGYSGDMIDRSLAYYAGEQGTGTKETEMLRAGLQWPKNSLQAQNGAKTNMPNTNLVEQAYRQRASNAFTSNPFQMYRGQETTGNLAELLRSQGKTPAEIAQILSALEG